MPPNENLWYRIGYALESARQSPPKAKRSLRGLADRAGELRETSKRTRVAPEAWPTADDLVASGIATVLAKALDAWKPKRDSGIVRLLRAGAAGAAAALVADVLGPLLRGEKGVRGVDRTTADRMIVGAGQGLVYGAVVEPRLPGPALLKGALYGTAEYAVEPVGGITKLVGGHAPQKRLPVISALLEDLDPHDRVYLEHVVFGIALALLYRSSASSNGIRVEVEEE